MWNQLLINWKEKMKNENCIWKNRSTTCDFAAVQADAGGDYRQGSYIITSGENLKPELSSNNLLKIRSGMMAHHGCISCVDIGTYDEVTLTNGSQGMKRIDLIVNRYTRNAETEVENCSWKVIQGKPVASNPAVPAYTSGNLQNGDLVDECPAFEVHYDGINVTEVKSLLM